MLNVLVGLSLLMSVVSLVISFNAANKAERIAVSLDSIFESLSQKLTLTHSEVKSDVSDLKKALKAPKEAKTAIKKKKK